MGRGLDLHCPCSPVPVYRPATRPEKGEIVRSVNKPCVIERGEK